jgi:hypothetical protein
VMPRATLRPPAPGQALDDAQGLDAGRTLPNAQASQ